MVLIRNMSISTFSLKGTIEILPVLTKCVQLKFLRLDVLFKEDTQVLDKLKAK